MPDALRIVRSLPHGHAAAVLGFLRKFQLDSLLDPKPSRQRDLAVAMIVARLLAPASKLATARARRPDTLHTSLGELLPVQSADETELYQAMDWLLARQPRIEQQLARRHWPADGLVLYDLTSTYFEGRHCPLAKLGHARDDKSGKRQIVCGLLTNADGTPVAVEVFDGNTADPKTVASQVVKLRKRFALQRVVLVGDRGMLTSARIREDLPPAHGIEWISALPANQIQKLAHKRRVADVLVRPDGPGRDRSSQLSRRTVDRSCYNPLLAEERARKRPELLAATERALEKIAAASRRPKRPLRG